MSLAIYVVGVALVVTVMLSSYFLGERGRDHARNTVYESGIKAFGSARLKFFAHYFLLAILFVIFDLESVFLYLWSSSIRELGWPAFWQMLFFVGMLLLALLYAMRAGVLHLLPRTRRNDRHEYN